MTEIEAKMPHETAELTPENECETCKHYDEFYSECKLKLHASDEFYCGYYCGKE